MSFQFLEDSKYWKGAELECVVRDFSMFIKDEGFIQVSVDLLSCLNGICQSLANLIENQAANTHGKVCRLFCSFPPGWWYYG